MAVQNSTNTGIEFSVLSISPSASIAVNLSFARAFSLTLNQNIAISSIQNAPPWSQKIKFELRIVQDATGGRTFSSSSGSIALFGTVNSAANSVSIVKFYSFDSGSNWTGIVENNFASSGGGTWGSIGGNIADQGDLITALGAKQNAIATGTVSQYLRGDLSLASFAPSVRGVTLAGVTATSGTIEITDNVLSAFGKTLKGLADVNTRVDNLTTPNTGFFNGGELASLDRKIGNRTAFSLGLIANDLERLTISSTGVTSIWSGSRYAYQFMSAGALSIGNLNAGFGNGTTGWNSNTAGLIYECNGTFETAIHHQGAAVKSLWLYQGSNSNHANASTLTISRPDIGGWDRIGKIIFTPYQSVFSTDKNFKTDNWSLDIARPTVGIAGSYPHLYLISNQSGNSSHGAAISLKEYVQGSTTNLRHWNIGQTNYGRTFAIGFTQGTDLNPHLSLHNYNLATGISIISPNNSTNLGDKYGISLNGKLEADYNLDLNEGTFGYGVSNTRTEYKLNASATDRLGKQSGFFQVGGGTISNYFAGADGNSLLIDSRHANGSDGLQIGARHDDDNLYFRKIGRTWNQLLSPLNGWSRSGNDLSSNPSANKIGSTSGTDMIFLCNNTEIFRLQSGSRQILAETSTVYGTAAAPNYAFRSNFGENCGMFYKAAGILSFSTNSAERLQIDNGSSVNFYLPIDLKGTQEIRMNGTKVVGTRGAALTIANNSAIGTSYDATAKAIIENLRTRLNELESRMQSYGAIN